MTDTDRQATVHWLRQQLRIARGHHPDRSNAHPVTLEFLNRLDAYLRTEPNATARPNDLVILDVPAWTSHPDRPITLPIGIEVDGLALLCPTGPIRVVGGYPDTYQVTTTILAASVNHRLVE